MTVVCLRHAQATHNLGFLLDENAYTDPRFRDAPLTEAGLEQAADAANNLQNEFGTFDAIFCSPLTRCLQTAAAVAAVAPAPIFADDRLIEEQGASHWCNERTTIWELRAAFPTVNFDGCDQTFTLWSTTAVREPADHVVARFNNFWNERVVGQPGNILIVTHHDVLYNRFGHSIRNAGYFQTN